MGVTFQDDLWVDILEHITMSPTGWQDVQTAWQSVKSSGMDGVFIQCSRCLSFYTSTIIARWPQSMAAYPGMGPWADELWPGNWSDRDSLWRMLCPQWVGRCNEPYVRGMGTGGVYFMNSQGLWETRCGSRTLSSFSLRQVQLSFLQRVTALSIGWWPPHVVFQVFFNFEEETKDKTWSELEQWPVLLWSGCHQSNMVEG